MANFDFIDIGITFSALMICMTDLIFTLMDKRTGKPQNKVYMIIIGLLAVNAVCNIITAAGSAGVLVPETAFVYMSVSRYIYFLTHNLLAPVFFLYISFVVGRSINWEIGWRYKENYHKTIIDFLPFIFALVSELIIVINPLINWIWYFDDNGVFHRAWGEFIFVYVLAVLWMLASFLLMMRSWNILSKSRKYSLAFCYVIVLTGVIIQLIFSHIRIEILMEALGFTGVLMFVENEDERRNVELDVYNPAAFELDVSAAIKNRTPVKIIIVKDIGFDKTSNTMVFGKVDGSGLDRSVADHLRTKVESYYIYSLKQGALALTLYDKSTEQVRQIANDILESFDTSWNVNGMAVYLNASVLIIDIPTRAKSVSDIMYIANCRTPESVDKGVLEGKDLDWIVRHAAVEKAVTRGLEENSFEVYYQPTFNMDKTIHGAEALLRMHDKELGDLFPDEFIPVAENLGLIDDIDDFVLAEVCRFIKTGVPKKYGIDCINVNLSVLECMKDGFAEHIISIVDSVGIEKSSINFEITESVAATDYKHLSKVIEKLKNEGFMFSIDDFGTGYSNMNSIFSLGADIIKIDKSVLWGAESSELGMVLLSATVKMVARMHKKTLVEGVETDNQINILSEMGANYLQGFYFSKPLPKEDFVSLISSL